MPKRTDRAGPPTRAEPPVPGTRHWWGHYATDELHGPMDTILRLLEQREITRSKSRAHAMRVLRFAMEGRRA